MLKRLIGDEQERLLAEERQWLSRLRTALDRCRLDEADLKTLDRSIQQLDQLFILVVVGEFNAGKSAFINALIGSPVLEEGVTPTTSAIQLLVRVRTGSAVEICATVMYDVRRFSESTVVDDETLVVFKAL